MLSLHQVDEVKLAGVRPPWDLAMDLNVFAVFFICGLYGFWRYYDLQRNRSRLDVIRSRVAWMLWTAANQVRT